MTTTLVLLLAAALVLWLWSEARAAAERAHAHAAAACRRAGVQLLDQTVSLRRISLRRGRTGALGVLRQFGYEYSRYGHDRNSGALALLGRELLWLHAPQGEHEAVDGGR
ncbi:MAG TPA: DUF3301 domain-containing protein [Xanthomonadaceae bacterium]|nr:DUF3301 domain-containing protein [Xanthomonadaceae bacterium]